MLLNLFNIGPQFTTNVIQNYADATWMDASVHALIQVKNPAGENWLLIMTMTDYPYAQENSLFLGIASSEKYNTVLLFVQEW